MSDTDGQLVEKSPAYIEVNGIRFGDRTPPEAVKSGLAYVPKKDDIFIVTFPKCGTTWLQNICFRLQHEGRKPTPSELMLSNPYLEFFGQDSVHKMQRPGTIKSHLAFDKCPFSPDAKYLVMLRNPKDTAVSFYHHTKSFSEYNFTDGTFEQYFEIFIAGRNDYGDYFDHLKGWYSQRCRENVLIVHYEDMKLSTKATILKIAKFLDLADVVLADNETILNAIIAETDVKQMKDEYHNYNLFDDEKVHDLEGGQMLKDIATDGKLFRHFVRRGIVGDWKNYFTKEMNERMNKRIQEALAPAEDYAELLKLWQNCGVFDDI